MRQALTFAALLACAGVPALAQTVLSPAQYVAAAGAGDLYEKTSSEMVLKDAKSADVKRFAQMMIADHTKTTSEVKTAALASHLKLAAPEMTSKQKAMLDELKSAPAGQREQIYLTQQRAAHREALALHQGYAATGSDNGLKKVATSAVPTVQQHVAEVDRLGSLKVRSMTDQVEQTAAELRKARIEERAKELWVAAGQPAGGPSGYSDDALEDIREQERAYDKSLADSFPASDPPAHSGITD
jgi:putative membrane protein